ncbi:hypothetical protein JF50_10515 [Pseudoalteromonas luteoviolacea]|uniref:NACHT domain-containing protein n=1 Tax=Pseudoalteromonas luteoviolacea TaxID=43657 RepID=A0A0C1QAG0_9GAMM|nr:NACHT domain-containing protein [Pseudoalteromonas luteoviolacea]KID57601.1 hypothetical protein JF50_10515 [Pseudoalteromonas luteoviolacea]
MNSYQLPALACETEFEYFVTDLCRLEYDNSFQVYGRKGQKQNGIDGIGSNENNKLVVHQCKKKRLDRQDKDIVKELLDDLVADAESFNQEFIVDKKFSVECFIFAHTFKNDVTLQKKATELTAKYKFKVIVWSWDFMVDKTMESQKLIDKYFAKLIKVNGKAIDPNNYISELSNIVADHYKSASFTRMVGLATSVDSANLNLTDTIAVDSSNPASQDSVKSSAMLLRDLIGSFSNNTPLKQLILGKPGVGKTTFLKTLCHKWSEKALDCPFKVILYISLRDWNSELPFTENVLNQFYEFNEKSNSSLENQYQLLKDNNQDILFLFDGLDEFKLKDNDAFISKVLEFDNVIFTSRPYAVNPNKLNINKKYEITGLSTPSLFNYIQKHLSTEEANNLKSLLQKEPALLELAHTPLILEILCIVFEGAQTESSTDFTNIASLYQCLLDRLLSDYCALKGLSKVEENEISIIKKLSELAFHSHIKNKAYIDVPETVEDREFFRDCLLKSGFLQSKLERLSIYKDNYSFYHLTFQEYLSALYISTLDEGEISEIIQKYKPYPNLNTMFKFLTGIYANKKFILKELDKGQRDIIGYHSLGLYLDCFNEAEGLDVEDCRFPREQVYKIIDYGMNNNLNVETLIYKIRDKEALLETYSKFGYNINKIAIFNQILLHTDFTKEIIEKFKDEKSKNLIDELTLKALSLNVITPLIEGKVDIKSYIKNKTSNSSFRYFTTDFNESEELLGEDILISALFNLYHYNQEYCLWISDLMLNSDTQNSIKTKLLFTTKNSDITEPSVLKNDSNADLNIEIECDDEHDIVFDDLALCAQFNTSSDKVDTANVILKELNTLPQEKVQKAKSAQLILEYLLSNDINQASDYSFMKLACRYLKRNYSLDLDEYICQLIEIIIEKEIDYTNKDIMYLLEHLALCEPKSARLKILYSHSLMISQ